MSFYRVIFKNIYIKLNRFFDSEPKPNPKKSHSSPELMFECCWFGVFFAPFSAVGSFPEHLNPSVSCWEDQRGWIWHEVMNFFGIRHSPRKRSILNFLFNFFSPFKSGPRVWGWKGPARPLLPQILLKLRVFIQGWGFPKASKTWISSLPSFPSPIWDLSWFCCQTRSSSGYFPFIFHSWR